jgi:hypothetical protein
MCKFWKKFCKKEKKNHHFPELVAKSDLKNRLLEITHQKTGLAVILILNLVAGIFYLTQTNITATYGFKIMDLEKELVILEAENKNLSLEYTKLQSIEKISQAVDYFKLVPINNSETLTVINNNIIALNRN